MKDKLFALIKELYALREVPQFLYSDRIDPNGFKGVRQAIIQRKAKGASFEEVDFILDSPGGIPGDAYRIIRSLRRSFDVVNVVVPLWAKSAATLLALGANRIVMDEAGELGPFDIQVAKQKDDSPYFDYESALNDEVSLELLEDRSKMLYHSMFIQIHNSEHIPISRTQLSKQLMNHISQFYEPLMRQINPYKLGERKRMSEITRKYAHRILVQFQPDVDGNRRANLIEYLTTQCPDHSFVVDLELIQVFMPDAAMPSGAWSDEYESKLAEISLLLSDYDSGVARFIGFVGEEEPETKESRPSSDKAKVSTKASRKAAGKNGRTEKSPSQN